jgi:hypothetical protein
MIFAVLGILSAVLFIVGDTPYLIDTLKGKTKPHRVGWGIVTLLNAIGFANQYASGATNSLWLFGGGAAMTGLIFLASLEYGMGGGTRLDWLCLAAGAVGVILWVLLKSPIYSILANILADVAALVPTFLKAIKYPETETKVAWLIAAFSSVLSTISVGRLDWQLLILPGVAIPLEGSMVYILYVYAPAKRRNLQAETQSA